MSGFGFTGRLYESTFRYWRQSDLLREFVQAFKRRLGQVGNIGGSTVREGCAYPLDVARTEFRFTSHAALPMLGDHEQGLPKGQVVVGGQYLQCLCRFP